MKNKFDQVQRFKLPDTYTSQEVVLASDYDGLKDYTAKLQGELEEAKDANQRAKSLIVLQADVNDKIVKALQTQLAAQGKEKGTTK